MPTDGSRRTTAPQWQRPRRKASRSVVQHEGHALRGCHRLEHHEQGRAHRFVEGDPLGGVRQWGGPGEEVCRDGFRQPLSDVAFTPDSRGAEQVEGDPAADSGQPGRRILDLCPLVLGHPIPPQVGLLHHVLGVGERARHPIRHRLQPSTFVLHIAQMCRYRVDPVAHDRIMPPRRPAASATTRRPGR